MKNNVVSIVSKQHEAWLAFQAAHLKAQRTLRMEDGIRAAKALHRFYDLFLGARRDPGSDKG